MKKRFLALALVISLISSGSDTTYASETTNDAALTESDQTIVIESDDINLNKAEQESYTECMDNLADEIKDSKSTDYSAIIQEYVENNDCSAQQEIEQSIFETVSDSSNNSENCQIELSEDVLDDYSESYVIDNTTSITVTPLYIEVTNIECLDDDSTSEDSLIGEILSYYTTDVNAATTKTKKYAESKDYYSWVGLKSFTIGLSCNFYYNGKKAWYKSGLDGFYTRGILSIWQVSNWKVGKESDGTSYMAYCSGNFHYGFEYKGVGIVIQEKYIRHRMTCNKNGNVSVTYLTR